MAFVHADAEHGGLVVDPREPVQGHKIDLSVHVCSQKRLCPGQAEQVLLDRNLGHTVTSLAVAVINAYCI